MIALIELVDEFGEAIESDLSILHGDNLRDFLLGHRPPGEALRKIEMIPPGWATHAQMQARPRSSDMTGKSTKPEPWRAFYGITPDTHALWDIYDAQFATTPGLKKPPKHPRTRTASSQRRGRPGAARATA